MRGHQSDAGMSNWYVRSLVSHSSEYACRYEYIKPVWCNVHDVFAPALHNCTIRSAHRQEGHVLPERVDEALDALIATCKDPILASVAALGL